MNKPLKITAIAVLAVGAICTLLTILAERTGPKRSWQLGSQTAKKRALIVYDPDPFYDLDEQVSRSFGKALADQGMHVTVASVAAAPDFTNQTMDLYVFCANTYSFRPDWAVRDFIQKQTNLDEKSVVAITVGSGSTADSQKALETLIQDKKANLLDSRSLWLFKPNDESRSKESNVAVAVSMAYTWGQEMAKRINVS
jgi:Cft2 family RNA processing exonuclease